MNNLEMLKLNMLKKKLEKQVHNQPVEIPLPEKKVELEVKPVVQEMARESHQVEPEKQR
jgi:hypothetical protein